MRARAIFGSHMLLDDEPGDVRDVLIDLQLAIASRSELEGVVELWLVTDETQHEIRGPDAVCVSLTAREARLLGVDLMDAAAAAPSTDGVTVQSTPIGGVLRLQRVRTENAADGHN